MKHTTVRFTQETQDMLVKLALAEAVKKGKRITNTEMLRRLINKAYKRLRK